MARTVYETAAAAGVGAVILELARSEQTYTFQRPIDYATSVLAGAVAAGWHGPVFIQGDHYQFNAKKYAADPEAMTEEIRRACRLAIDAGYRNIDIDSSTLVDLSKPNVDEEQRENYRRAAELTALIRTLEPDGVTISVGGEIGEVGTQNSTVEELRAYLDGYRRELDGAGPGRHGHLQGQRPDRAPRTVASRCPTAAWPRSSSTSRSCASSAWSPASTAWPGAVQHGASTLPDELFHRFPAVETAEIHLATGFQNALYEHPAFPDELHREIEAWCFGNAADERKPGQTDQQFVYTTRKKAIGPFKRRLWELETKDEILAAQRRKIAYLFTELRVNDSRDDGRALRPPGRAPPAGAGRPARGRRRRLRQAFDRARLRCYPPAQVRRRREGAARIVPGVLVCQLQRSARTLAVRWEEESSWRDQVVPRTSPRATTRTCDRSGSSRS